MNKLKVNNVTIGSDPECFLWSENKQKYVPVCGLVGGTKDKPIPITDEGHAIQEDNVAVEFCIPAAKDADTFIKDINFVKGYLNETVLAAKELQLAYIASVKFTKEDLDSKQAQEFGCDPDYNAWTYEQNVIDKSNIDPCLRSAGFHIHIGYDKPDLEVSIELVRAFDLFVLLPSILLDPDTKRRQLYGKAGCYRFKKYGVECRGLSSYFVGSDELIKWVFDNTMKAIDFVNSGKEILDGEILQECINTSNKDLAYNLLKKHGIANEELYKLIKEEV